MPRSTRRKTAFVAWGAVGGRSAEIATALGGEARCFFPPGQGRRPPVLLRYAASAVGTAAFLARRRPRVVIVTNPPIVAALSTYLLARTLDVPVILDSHPGGFGAQGDRVSARLQGWHRWLAARAGLVLVTDQAWCDVVESWGGRAMVVHEAPGGWTCPPPARHERLRVLVVGSFGSDEPVEAVLEAAARLPEVDFSLTGEPASRPATAWERAASNVRLVGFLGPAGYHAEVARSDAVVTLTTEPTSVMRAAYEAVYVGRPLVVSDWPVNRELFPHAVFTANDGTALATAISRLDAEYEHFAGYVDDARAHQLERWEAQRAELRRQIDLLAAGR